MYGARTPHHRFKATRTQQHWLLNKAKATVAQGQAETRSTLGKDQSLFPFLFIF
jgi:hypothetical protein